MRTLFNDVIFDQLTARQSDKHQHLIRVNGRRSVGAYGATQQEAYQNALIVAKETWPSVSHIFDLLAPESVV